jgi:hypothetical protein
MSREEYQFIFCSTIGGVGAMFMPNFDGTELERELRTLPHSHWKYPDGRPLKVCYHLNKIDFDYGDWHRSLRIVSADFVQLCRDFAVDFEFVPVEVGLRRKGVNKRNAKPEDFNVTPAKQYGLFFMKPVYAMDFERSLFCVKRDQEGRAITDPKIPYKHKLRCVYEYKVDAERMKGVHLFPPAELIVGRYPELICSKSFMDEFIRRGLKGPSFLGLKPELEPTDFRVWPELDPRCWILDKGEEEIFFQPENPRPPRPKLPG